MTQNNMFDMCDRSLVHKGFISKRILSALQMAGMVGLLFTGGFVGYRWYSVHREQAAQRQFADCIKEYTNTTTGQLGHQNWSMISTIFEDGAKKYSRSALAPFYLAYQAQALLHSNKLSEAAAVMNHAVSIMSPKNDLYYLYALKSALMNIDAATIANLPTHDAEQQLIDLAHNPNNHQRDAALFYLGRYYLSQNNDTQAQQAFQELISMPHQDTKELSPWIKEAKTLIGQVTS